MENFAAFDLKGNNGRQTLLTCAVISATLPPIIFADYRRRRGEVAAVSPSMRFVRPWWGRDCFPEKIHFSSSSFFLLFSFFFSFLCSFIPREIELFQYRKEGRLFETCINTLCIVTRRLSTSGRQVTTTKRTCGGNGARTTKESIMSLPPPPPPSPLLLFGK